MFNELGLLKFQVENELILYGKDSFVMVFSNEITGQYIDYFINNDRIRSAPNVIQQQMYHRDSLGNLYNAIIDEMRSR